MGDPNSVIIFHTSQKSQLLEFSGNLASPFRGVILKAVGLGKENDKRKFVRKYYVVIIGYYWKF